jgi:hypothetical protein
MTYKEAINFLKKKFEVYFAAEGFALTEIRYGRFEFRKNVDKDLRTIGIHLDSHIENFIYPYLRLRLNFYKVFEILKNSGIYHHNAKHEDDITIRSFDRYEYSFESFKVNSEEVALQLYNKFISYYEEDKSFFDDTTLEKLDKLLNKYPQPAENALHRNYEIDTIIAKICNNPHVVELAIIDYHKLISDEQIINFEKLMDYLKIPYQKRIIIKKDLEANTVVEEISETETYTVKGFDSSGEPEISISDDGSLQLIFCFMPPLNGKDEPDESELWDVFETVLSKKLGVEVLRDDREVFLIPNPNTDTKDVLINYLENFHRN